MIFVLVLLMVMDKYKSNQIKIYVLLPYNWLDRRHNNNNKKQQVNLRQLNEKAFHLQFQTLTVS